LNISQPMLSARTKGLGVAIVSAFYYLWQRACILKGMSTSHYTSANLGGIKRGDSEETGDLEARPTEKSDQDLQPDEGLDELTVKDASDPSLDLTNIGEVPPEDWAANTGPTRTNEEAAPSHKR
jgi:hypothetical protein